MSLKLLLLVKILLPEIICEQSSRISLYFDIDTRIINILIFITVTKRVKEKIIKLFKYIILKFTVI